MKGPHGRGVEREGRRSIQFERLDFPVVGKADKRPGIYASKREPKQTAVVPIAIDLASGLDEAVALSDRARGRGADCLL
jgi:hypothetical protein